MNTAITTDMFKVSSLALALGVVVGLPVQAESVAAITAVNKTIPEPKTMENCHSMPAQKQKMLDDMKAQDAGLTEELAKMNSAPDDKKVGLMAAVVTHIVEQRIAMDARKAKIEEMMMLHMQMRKEAEAMPHAAAPTESNKK